MLQYNLRSLLLAMLAVCVATWLFFVLPGELGVILLMMLLAIVPGVVLAGLLYCRGNMRAFFVGCVPPMLILSCAFIFEGPPQFFGRGGATETKVFLTICVAVVMASGAAAAAVRYFARRQPLTNS